MRLPKAFPDESLYSRICRHLATSGLTKSQYLNMIIGDSRASIHPYLNANLNALCNLLNEPIQNVWTNQTLAPLFAYFLPNYRYVISDPRASPNGLIRACQISAFREKERLCVKLCHECVVEDISEYGVPYWHCLHQVSGVEACPIHGIWLTHIALIERSHIMLPPLDSVQIEHCSAMAVKFANYCKEYLRKIRANECDFSSTRRLEKLKAKGFITHTGHVRRRLVCRELYTITENILPPDSIFHPQSAQDFLYWSPVLSGATNQPPFKQLLIDFYLDEIAQTIREPVEDEINRTKTECDTCCCDLLHQGLSMAEVGRQIGKSRCYVKRVALENNIPVNLKPKIITDHLKENVVKMARKGFHRKVIADKYNISTGSVEMIITTTNGLVEWRKLCKSQSMCRRYKAQLTRYRASFPASSRQDIKKACEAAFFWLYLHHREWLESHLPIPLDYNQPCKVDWHERDLELSREVKRLLDASHCKLTRTDLDQLLGGHSWLTSKKSKLPLTLEVISDRKIKIISKKLN